MASEYFTACSLEGQPIPTRQWHVPSLVPAHSVTMLSGDGGAGKSLIALQLAIATAGGGRWLDQTVNRGEVLFISTEDSRDDLHIRVTDIARAEGVALSDLGGLTLRSLCGIDAVLARPGQRDGSSLSATPLYDEIETWLETYKPKLLILDTLANFFGGNEIIRGQAQQFIGLLQGLALVHKVTVLLLAHPSLTGIATGTGSSGSTAWNNSVRSRLYLTRGKSGDMNNNDQVLSVVKSNYGQIGATLNLSYQEGVFVFRSKEESVGAALQAVAKAERVFLKLLGIVTEEGRHVNPNGSTTFAPSVFASRPDSENCTKAAFKKAMDTLIVQGKVFVHTDGPPSRRVTYLSLSNVD